MKAIEIKGLSFRYVRSEVFALKNVDLVVNEGEKLLILGPSGCGKTTLLRCINGLIPHRYRGELLGTVKVFGENVAETPIHKISLKVGTVLQDPESQFVGISVEEDVAFGLENLRFSREEMRRLVAESLSVVGLTGMEQRAPHEMSGGQKQKVALAGVLAMRPSVILFDEPLANLDPASADEILDFMDVLNREYGKTIVIVEHRFEQVLEKGVDKIAVMSDGRVVAYGTPEDIMERADLLVKIGIRLPLYAEVAYQLKKRGLWEGPLPLSVEETASRLKGSVRARIEGKLEVPSEKPDRKPILEFRDVHYVYPTGVKAIRGVDLKIYPGEVVALMGPNGAGKSTLSLLSIGILKPTRGRVLVDGVDTRDATVAQLARTVGIIFQNPNHMLFKNSVEEEIAFGPKNLGYSEEEIERFVEQAMQICDLKRYRGRHPLSLSMGERKRVCIAAALSMNPRLLFFDEPTVGQDHRHSEAFMSYIKRLREKGYTIVIITHNVNLAIEYCQRAVIMVDGKIIADGPTQKVLADEPLLKKARLKPTSITRLMKALNLPPLAITSQDLQTLLIKS